MKSINTKEDFDNSIQNDVNLPECFGYSPEGYMILDAHEVFVKKRGNLVTYALMRLFSKQPELKLGEVDINFAIHANEPCGYGPCTCGSSCSPKITIVLYPKVRNTVQSMGDEVI